MKNKMLIIIFIGFILLTLTLFLFYPRLKYPPGRDTEVLLGDGTYQILRRIDFNYLDLTGEERYKYNLSGVDGKTIEDNVYKYRKIKDKIYVTGETGYTILNFETGELFQSKNINDFSTDDKNIFLANSRFKVLFEE